MKQSTWTEERIITVLRQADTGDRLLAALCRAHGIAENTFYKWCKKYGGMEVSAAKQLRDLEQENARLKRLLADSRLEIDALKDVLTKKIPLTKSSTTSHG
jgi:putative transposase